MHTMEDQGILLETILAKIPAEGLPSAERSANQNAGPIPSPEIIGTAAEEGPRSQHVVWNVKSLGTQLAAAVHMHGPILRLRHMQ